MHERPGLEPHLVQPVDAGRRAVPVVPDLSGRCWHQGAAATTDSTCMPRQMPSTGRSRSSAARISGELAGVPLGTQAGRLRVRGCAVQGRVEVRPPAKHHRVEPVEQAAVSAAADGGSTTARAARGLDLARRTRTESTTARLSHTPQRACSTYA